MLFSQHNYYIILEFQVGSLRMFLDVVYGNLAHGLRGFKVKSVQ